MLNCLDCSNGEVSPVSDAFDFVDDRSSFLTTTNEVAVEAVTDEAFGNSLIGRFECLGENLTSKDTGMGSGSVALTSKISYVLLHGDDSISMYNSGK